MPRHVSPAASAAVSRKLHQAGIMRATEYRKGIEYEGYWAEPREDHVRVDYAPGLMVEPENAVAAIREKLNRCKAVLEEAGYEVTEVIDTNYIYGGNPAVSMPVLEVRREAWTRRDNDG